MIMTKLSQKAVLGIFCVLAAACVRPIGGAFGVPEFLEFGTCFNATLQDGFDPVKYQGLWFSIQSVPNEYEIAEQCNSMNYTWYGDRMVSVGKGVTKDGKKVRQVSELLEELELRDPPHPAYLTVLADGVPESPYEILETDYVTYSCVHSCLEYFGFKAEFFWVFGRTPYLSRDYVALCHDAFTDMGVDTSKLFYVPHGETCPYNKKLGDMLEKNREVMIRLGILDESAPRFPTVPPPTEEAPAPSGEETKNEVVGGKVTPIFGAPPISGDETLLEDPMPVPDSSAPLKADSIVIPLFVLIAVLLPAVAR